MKKLMIAAAAVGIAGGAFAAPQVYEYKAALKNMNLKEVKVTLDKVPYTVYMKYATSTSLKGWLIMDQDGVTSPTIMDDLYGMSGLVYGSASTGFDYGRNRGFLVVINPKAYKAVRRPKILPAILDAKWLDTAFAKRGTALSGPAEGYLYVGGDAVKPVRPQIDYLWSLLDNDPDRAQRSNTNAVPVIGAQVPYVPAVAASSNAVAASSVVATNYSGMVAIADYVWTSVYLFAGSTEKDAYFNGPNWFQIGKGVAAYSPFGMFEFAWDQNLPPFLQTGWITNSLYTANRPRGKNSALVNYYHDTWMNGSGVAGKWSRNKEDGEQCCGIISTDTVDRPVLETLSGNVKGGLFLCTENGIDAKDTKYSWLLGPDVQWEDQFITARLNKSVLFKSDSWQNDLWQDGFFEIETTDVITGTWIIKRATGKFFAKKNPIAVALTKAEEDTLKDATDAKVPETISKTVSEQATAPDPNDLDPDTQEPIVKPVYIGPDGADTFDTVSQDPGTGEDVNNPPKMVDVTVTSGEGEVVWDDYLWMAIKGAALDLAKKNGGSVTLFDGTEIYTKTSSERSKIPMVTPQFALYYRLVYGVYSYQDQP